MQPNFRNGLLLWAAVFLISAAIIAGVLKISQQPSEEELQAQALEDLKADFRKLQEKLQ